MTRILFLLSTILLLQCNNLHAQQHKLFPFKINGTINADTGTVQMKMLVDTRYYPPGVKNLTAKVENKKFTFHGFIPYPQGVQLYYNSAYYSNSFVIEQGIQSVTFNIDSNDKTPEVHNRVMKEYYEGYKMAFKEIHSKREVFRQKWDSLSNIFQRKIPATIQLGLEKELNGYYKESDAMLLKYVIAHPNSYVAFWKFIELLNFGYEPVFDSILPRFSASLRNTYTGKVLSKKLKVAGMLSLEKEFPSFPCINDQNKKLDPASFKKKIHAD